MKFQHGDFYNLEDTNEGNFKRYDLEQYYVPAVIRKCLKTTKKKEIMQVECKNIAKLTDHFDDDVFKKEWLSSFKDKVVITIVLLDFE